MTHSTPASRRPAALLCAAVAGATLFTSGLGQAVTAAPDEVGADTTTPVGEPFDVGRVPDDVLDDDTVIVTEFGLLIEEPEPFADWPDWLVAHVADAAADPDPDPGGDADDPSGETAESPSASQAFNLSSRPGADLTIYLDFDGHTTAGTPWNSSSSRPDSFYSAPYSRDSSSGFNNTELEYIGLIWEQVAEDYSPFDVNVTTIEPAFDNLWRANSADHVYGTRIVISPTQDWYGNSGGVAYVGSFDWINLRTPSPDFDPVTAPAFVFSNALGGGHYKYVAEAASHEAGHTLDLQHDGYQSSSYYGGHSVQGGGGWAPIMGVGYTQEITQWSGGDYPGATSTQDDVAILASNLGWRSAGSGGGSTVVGPPTLTAGDSYVGIVEQSTSATDIDISVPAGATSITITPAVPSSNLLASAQLLRGNTVLVGASPTSAVDWQLDIDRQLSAGIYTVRLTSLNWASTSSGNLNGFTKYGSIGQFRITLDVVADPTVVTTTPTTTTPPTTPTTAPPTTAPTGDTSTGTTTPTTNPPSNPIDNQLTTTRPAGCAQSAGGGLMGFSEQQATGQPCFMQATRLG